MKKKVVIVFLIASLIIAIALCMISCNKNDATNNSTNNGNNDQPSNGTVSSGDNNSSSGDNVTDGNKEPSSGDSSSSGDDNDNQNPSCNHTYSDKWSMDETFHWHVSTCGHELIKDKERHNWDSGEITKPASCTESGVMTYKCLICEAIRNEAIPATGHTYSTAWNKDETYHWRETTCGHNVIKDKAEHNYANTDICKECKYNNSNELIYELWNNDTEYFVKGISNKSIKEIVILNKYKGLPVTGIGSNAFQYCSSLTSIEIPNSVTNIGDSAFKSCSNLTSIEIPNSVTNISSSAFYNCSSLTGVYITDIASWCAIDFGSSYANPLYYAHNLYLNNELVTELVIPGSVTSIGSNAFQYCSSLISIEIPNSVTNIGFNAFEDCSRLTGVYITDIASWCAIDFGSSYSNPLYYAHNLYLNNELVTELVIPSSVTSIGNNVFKGCSSVTSIEIPSSVTSIGRDAFLGCRSLTSIVIPFVGETKDGTSNTHFGYIFGAIYGSDNGSSVPSSLKKVVITGGRSIYHESFTGCSSLTSVEIPNSVTSIGRDAFRGCRKLTSIEIPSSVTSISEYAFEDCSNLTIYCEATSRPSGWDSRWNLISRTSPIKYAPVIWGYNLTYNGIAYGIKDGEATVIRQSTAINGGVVIANEVTYKGTVYRVTCIGDDAFSGCSSLTSIKIPNGVTSIGRDTFLGCSSLTSVTFGVNSQLTSIGNSAFKSCSSLTSIEIPNSVTSIGNVAFENCSGLTGVYITDIASWCAIDFGSSYANPLSYADNLYLNKELVTELVIPESVTSIGRGAFFGCRSLTSIEIPNSVTSIGNVAFENCSGLTGVYITDIARWCAIDFGNSYANPLYYAHNLYLNNELVTELVIPEGVTSIGDSAFSDCSNLTSIEIPNSVTSIGNSAFSDCSSLIGIEISSSVTSIGDSAFEGCIRLESIIVDTNNTVYKSECNCIITKSTNTLILGCKKSVIPNYVTSIYDFAFSGCSSLTSIEIPDSVTSIGERAFEDCSSLTIYCEAVSKPSGWASNWNYGNRPVVWNCKNNEIASDGNIYYVADNGIRYALKDGEATVVEQSRSISGAVIIPSEVTYKGNTYSVTSIGNQTFSLCSSLTSIVIPSSVTSMGSYAFLGCSSLTIYCEATSKPSGWVDRHWNVISSSFPSEYAPVIWGYNLTYNGIAYGIKDGEATVIRQLTTISGRVVIASEVTYKGTVYRVTSIGDDAFLGCSSLISIKIPNGVTSIGRDTFFGCSSLTSVTFGENSQLTSIGYRAFYGCSSLISIGIPNSVTSIGDSAFSNCSSLSSISIPSSLKIIGKDVFSGCANLQFNEYDNGFYLGDKDNQYLLFIRSKDYEITSCQININTKIIYSYAFSGCSSLTSIKIPSGVTSIGNSAFSGCSSLISIEIPSGVTSIGNSAFSGCSSLTSIVIPSSVTSIGNFAFYKCSNRLIIYCKVASKPNGWSDNWNCINDLSHSYVPVKWDL